MKFPHLPTLLLLGIGIHTSACNSPSPSTNPSTPPSASAPQPSASTPQPSAPQDKGSGTVTLHGQTLTIQSALLRSSGGKEKKLTLSTAPLTCDDIKRPSRTLAPKEISIDLGITPPIQGIPLQTIITLIYPMTPSNFPMSTTLSSTTQTPLPEPSNGQLKTTLNIRHNQPADTLKNQPAQTVDIQGEFIFNDCGGPNSPPQTNPQPTFKLSAGGEDIPLQSALLLPHEKHHRLILSSNPLDCNRSHSPDLQLEIGLKPGDSDIKSIVMTGNRVRGTSQGNPAKIQAKSPKKLSKPGQHQQLSLQGKTEFPSQGEEGKIVWIPVQLEGELSALVCEK